MPNKDHHLSPHSYVAMMLGDFPVRMVDGKSRSSISATVESLAHDTDSDTFVVGLPLSPLREVIFAGSRILGLKPGMPGGMGYFTQSIANAGWQLEEAIAVFPNLESARFCFPVEDTDSHRFLIREILYSRRYSLNRRTRFLLSVYRILVSIIPQPAFLYQSSFVRIRRA